MALWVRNGLLAQAGVVAVFIYFSIRNINGLTPLVGIMFLLVSGFAWGICFTDDRLDLRYGREKATKITMLIISFFLMILVGSCCVFSMNT